VPKSPFTPRRFFKLCDFVPRDSHVRSNDKLGNPITCAHNKIVFPEVSKYHHDFASVIRVDCTGGIQYSNAVFECQPTARSNLRFKTGRKLNAKTRWYENSLTRFDRDSAFHGSAQVHPGRACSHIRG